MPSSRPFTPYSSKTKAAARKGLGRTNVPNATKPIRQIGPSVDAGRKTKGPAHLKCEAPISPRG